MKHVIIGTAGHVDHGKTALVKALTGQDTDRLPEEKTRGISIDLGFAHFSLSNTLDAAIVDVPGHERFLKNMLAGVGGIDLALLVVAADEGVMPQTREHLAMLDLFGIKKGIIALTKIDKADVEWLELIEDEIRESVKGTFLADASMLRVSSVTGQGIKELQKALFLAAESVIGRDQAAPFRLWIDRAFTVKGYGVVVTGSVLSGSVAIGDALCLQPKGCTVKVRGIQTHGENAEQAAAGQRAAINLSGTEAGQAGRGMLLTCPSRALVSQTWDITANWCEEVKGGMRVRLHLGTGEWIGRLRMAANTPPGLARLSLEEPLPGSAGESGILRLYSPQTLLGGVTLIAPIDRRRPLSATAGLAAALSSGDADTIISEITRLTSMPLTLSAIKRSAGYLPDSACRESLDRMESEGHILQLEDSYLSTQAAEQIANNVLIKLKQEQSLPAKNAGISKETVRQWTHLEERWFDFLIERWDEAGRITRTGSVIALPEQRSHYRQWLHSAVERVDAFYGKAGLCHIDSGTLARDLMLDSLSAKNMYESLLREDILVRTGDIVVYSKTLQYNVSLIQQYLAEFKTATTAQLRDIMHTSRKLAIPLLEYCDMHKYTMREGDLRRLGQKRAEFPE